MRGCLMALAAALVLGGCSGALQPTEKTPLPSSRPTVGSRSIAPGSPSPAASGRLAHFDQDGLVFDYPPSWQVSHAGLNEHYFTILDVLGTGSGGVGCAEITPGPSVAPGSACRTAISLGPGQVVVELVRQDGPGMRGSIDPANPGLLEPGNRFVTIGGLPAIAGEVPDPTWGADLAMGWTLSVPTQLNSRYQVNAYLKAPGLAATRAQVEALVASMAFDPPTPVLDTADATRVLSTGLARAAAYDPSLACFPAVPGTVAHATVTALPMSSELRKPLPVTCTTTIEPELIGLWKVTLTESWTAAADRSAGSLATTMWLGADGSPGQIDGGRPTSGIPYWPK